MPGTPRRALGVLAALLLVALVAAAGGHDVAGRLAPGGWTPAGAQSTRAETLLASRFGAGQPQLVLLARADRPVDDPAVARAGRELTDRLAADPRTTWVRGYWPHRDASLRGHDGHSAVVGIRFAGDERAVLAASKAVAARETAHGGVLTVAAAGEGPLYTEMERLGTEGATVAELVIAPLVLLIMLWVFGSVVAALLPVVVGAFAVVTTTALLRLMSEVTTVSVFVLNIATALGFGLAVDYCLLMVSRYREELARGLTPPAAARSTVRSAGRAVAFSATTVAAALGALLVFPLPLTRSLALGGAAVSLCSAAGALLLLPALLVLLGAHINRWDVFARWRRGAARPVHEGRWYRLALWVTRRPAAVALGTLALLGLLAAPGAGARFGMYDERVLPDSSPVAEAHRRLRADFGTESQDAAMVVLPDVRLGPLAGLRLRGGGAAGGSRVPAGMLRPSPPEGSTAEPPSARSRPGATDGRRAEPGHDAARTTTGVRGSRPSSRGTAVHHRRGRAGHHTWPAHHPRTGSGSRSGSGSAKPKTKPQPSPARRTPAASPSYGTDDERLRDDDGGPGSHVHPQTRAGRAPLSLHADLWLPGARRPLGLGTAVGGRPGRAAVALLPPAHDAAGPSPAPRARAHRSAPRVVERVPAAVVAVDAYAVRLSRVPGVRQVQTATGLYDHGRRTAAAGAWGAGFTGEAGTWLSVTPDAPPLSPDGRALTERLRGVPAPGRALVGGPGARMTDTEQALGGRLPAAIALTVAATLALLFLYTRSLLVPLKAVALNGLSLAATFGIVVAVFQNHWLEAVLGPLRGPHITDVTIPAVMFCTAFGLSMDYEVFLLSRILEEHRRGTPTRIAVATGLQRTARLFTSAALVFAVVMMSLAACDLIMLQVIGFGLAVAVALDCTLVRALLVPAIMSLAGNANWWPAGRRRAGGEPAGTPSTHNKVANPVAK
ncbi:hypothetical protein GCM10010218_53030 [Streptomyces mashuensis]|uniref:Membrane transport protein MMPL domain-containing protein n=1 Tax=Streptomyces mashuensis TaxID=33904 RepID=A0A919EFF7_9ACTN|nr:hypothetical protein GCM10010218_53030 [Streptomyces mashuensis]